MVIPRQFTGSKLDFEKMLKLLGTKEVKEQTPWFSQGVVVVSLGQQGGGQTIARCLLRCHALPNLNGQLDASPPSPTHTLDPRVTFVFAILYIQAGH